MVCLPLEMEEVTIRSQSGLGPNNMPDNLMSKQHQIILQKEFVKLIHHKQGA